jgi:hypothetical protein
VAGFVAKNGGGANLQVLHFWSQKLAVRFLAVKNKSLNVLRLVLTKQKTLYINWTKK